MARVTVEDCCRIIPNRFELVVYAAQRARQISAGSALTVERDNDKNPVVALREIVKRDIKHEILRANVIKDFRKYVEVEPIEEDYDGESLLAQEQDNESYIQVQQKELNEMNLEDEQVSESIEKSEDE